MSKGSSMLADSMTESAGGAEVESLEASPGASSVQTRERLLEAAGREFAESGFRRATVRNICKRAGANIAAVNYHFGDKESLYLAALKHWLALSIRQYPPDMGVAAGAPADDRLRGFVRGLLFRLLATGAPAWHGQLMAREMIEPTAAIDAVIADTVRPMAGHLEAIVAELIGADAGGQVVRRAALSIVGQCCFYRHAQEMLRRMFPDLPHDTAALESLADHITRFSLAGLAACKPASIS